MRVLVPALLLLLPFSANAQETQTISRVTPAGVFQDVIPGHTASSVLAATNPNPSATGQRWVYPNPAGMPWITEYVSVGNHGTFSWLGQNQNFERVTLVSSTDDQSPAQPIYEDSLQNADLVETAAADKAPVCAVSNRDFQNGLYEVRLYSGFNPIPVGLATVPSTGALELAISDDGERVAVGYSHISGLAAVDVFDTFGGTTLQYLNTYLATGGTAFREHDISGDGQTLLLATQNADWLFDVNTGNPIFTDGSTVSVDAHSINSDGSAWARGGFDLGAWKLNAGVYNRVVNFKDTQMGFFVCTACDISGDGSTFVAAAYDATNNNRMSVYCFSLTPTSSSLLWRYTSIGTGGFQDTPQSVSISDDGRWIAVGTWGTQNNAHPELLLFDRNAGNVPVGGIDTPGSVFSADISGDGQFAVAGTKSVHANTFGNGGEGYSLDRGGQGLRLFGTPSINRQITFVVGGTPGEPVLLTAGLALLPVGLTSPSFMGTFDLNPSTLILPPTFLAPIQANSELAIPVILPNNPIAVGITVYVQAIRNGLVTTIDNYVALPFTP